MSQPLDGWETAALINCVRERIDVICALCHIVLDDEHAESQARELAEGVLRELGGGEAS